MVMAGATLRSTTGTATGSVVCATDSFVAHAVAVIAASAPTRAALRTFGQPWEFCRLAYTRSSMGRRRWDHGGELVPTVAARLQRYGVVNGRLYFLIETVKRTSSVFPTFFCE